MNNGGNGYSRKYLFIIPNSTKKTLKITYLRLGEKVAHKVYKMLNLNHWFTVYFHRDNFCSLFTRLHCTSVQCTMNQFLYLFDLMRIFIRRIFTNHIFTYFLMNNINTSNSQNRFNLGQNILELATKNPSKSKHFLENAPKTYI